MQPAHIGVFLNGYPDPDGTTTAVRGLNRALANLGYKITIYCSGHQQPGTEEQLDNLRVVHYERQHDHPFHVPEALCARVAVNEDDIDFLILHAMFSPANISMARAARAGAIPYVVCPHDPYHPQLLRKNRLQKLVYQWIFEKPLLRGAAAVQLLDERHASHLSAFGIRTSTIVVPNGFDPKDVPPPDTALRLPGRPSFLYLGRLDIHHKGLDLLVEAVSQGRRNGELPRTLVVNFVGPEDASRQQLEKLASKRGVSSNFNVVGWLSNERRWAALRGCDASILCSRYDGFGLSALETMVAGRPVILSTETGLYSWAHRARCGFFIEPCVESIAAGLMRAVKGEAHWNKMGARGQDFAYSQMTWDRIGNDAHQQYQALLCRLNGRQPAAELRARTANGA